MSAPTTVEILEGWRKAIIIHLKDYPDLGECHWNCTTMKGFQEVIDRIVAKVQLEEHDKWCPDCRSTVKWYNFNTGEYEANRCGRGAALVRIISPPLPPP